MHLEQFCHNNSLKLLIKTIFKTAFFTKTEIKIEKLTSTKLSKTSTKLNAIEKKVSFFAEIKNSTFFDGNKKVEFQKSKHPKKASQPQYRSDKIYFWPQPKQWQGYQKSGFWRRADVLGLKILHRWFRWKSPNQI